ncbi:MAG: M13 family metallopeptidase N-terminal domain-containing protein, partial [Telluria sp.]|nr:M13 family metallopeptidase N-terminal domain-containing protein [Telluria sp.]
MKRYLLSTLTLSLMAAFATAAPAPAAPAAPISGIDTQFIDPSVRAQDDFFTYLNGKWLKSTEIPADKSSWGTFAKLRDDVQPQVRAIIEAAQADSNAGPDARKIGDLYASYMDEARREQLGYKPLAGELARIRSLKDKKALPGLIAHLSKIGVNSPYGMFVGQDARESTRYAVYVGQRGLGLPDRDWYLKKDDAKMADQRAKYEKHVENMLGMVGHKDAAAAARNIVAFETELAQVQWSKVENRDPVKRYN